MANRPYCLPNILEAKLLTGLAADHADTCTLEATVISGFEGTAKEEVSEIFLTRPSLLRGRLFFDVPTNHVSEALQLRSVDSINVMVEALKKFKEIALELDWEKALKVWKDVTGYQGDLRPELDEDLLRRLEKVLREEENKPEVADTESPTTETALPVDATPETQVLEPEFATDNELDGLNTLPQPDEDIQEKGVEEGFPVLENTEEKTVEEAAGEDFSALEDKQKPIGEQLKAEMPVEVETQGAVSEETSNEPAEQESVLVEGYKGPKFRVTCHRVGNHSFGSMDAAKTFGAGVFQKHHWKVDMKSYDLEIILNIDNNRVYVSLALCKDSLFKRNICAFGRTVVRSTMCYNILRLAHPSPGDVIIDPMCGSGTIPIESSIGYPWSYNICGDVYNKAIERTKLNIQFAAKQSIHAPLNPDVLLWDIWELPLREGSVDIFVTDLPYGKRMGKRDDNRVLYLRVLRQMAFAARLVTGKAILMTHDKGSMIKGMQQTGKFWKNLRTVSINHGGLNAFVFVLYRTNAPFVHTVAKKVSETAKQNAETVPELEPKVEEKLEKKEGQVPEEASTIDTELNMESELKQNEIAEPVPELEPKVEEKLEKQEGQQVPKEASTIDTELNVESELKQNEIAEPVPRIESELGEIQETRVQKEESCVESCVESEPNVEVELKQEDISESVDAPQREANEEEIQETEVQKEKPCLKIQPDVEPELAVKDGELKETDIQNKEPVSQLEEQPPFTKSSTVTMNGAVEVQVGQVSDEKVELTSKMDALNLTQDSAALEQTETKDSGDVSGLKVNEAQTVDTPQTQSGDLQEATKTDEQTEDVKSDVKSGKCAVS